MSAGSAASVLTFPLDLSCVRIFVFLKFPAGVNPLCLFFSRGCWGAFLGGGGDPTFSCFPQLSFFIGAGFLLLPRLLLQSLGHSLFLRYAIHQGCPSPLSPSNFFCGPFPRSFSFFVSKSYLCWCLLLWRSLAFLFPSALSLLPAFGLLGFVFRFFLIDDILMGFVSLACDFFLRRLVVSRVMHSLCTWLVRRYGRLSLRNISFLLPGPWHFPLPLFSLPPLTPLMVPSGLLRSSVGGKDIFPPSILLVRTFVLFQQPVFVCT